MKLCARNYHVYVFYAFLLVMSSCVKEMDFDGVKDITLEPEMEAKLAHAEITTEQIIVKLEQGAEDAGLSQPYPSQIYTAGLPPISSDAPVEITSEERVIKYLERALLNFNIGNTTPRAMEIRVELLRDDNSVIDFLEETIPANTASFIPKPLEFNGKSAIEELKQMTQVKIDITMKQGADLRVDPSGKFEMTTTGIFKFNYDISEGLP